VAPTGGAGGNCICGSAGALIDPNTRVNSLGAALCGVPTGATG
jgi:hypothetical protein